MNKSSLKAGVFFLQSGWKVAGFLLRHLVTIVLVVLFLIALVLGYWAWQMGFPATMPVPILIPLALCLTLIIAIVLGRSKIRRWALSSAARGQARMQKRVAESLIQEGREKGQQVLQKGEEVLEKGVGAAKEALSSLAGEVQADWQRQVSGPTPVVSQAPRCPACGYFVRPGAKFCDRCGQPLQLTCPKCGQALRPQARFCERCGAQVSGGRTS
ncbi:MAG: zinc ribbon domain-containing protein [Anaerolineae bacterium]|jgi:preprotein translocase subunit SecG|nr:zinc ribbon domain-containing protein [Anaerolineae bacterium]MDH7473042.1 zinc ribbon domain-containing protein [Anaerolineae bacterium]